MDYSAGIGCGVKIDALSAEMDELKAANKQLRHRIEQLESRDWISAKKYSKNEKTQQSTK